MIVAQSFAKNMGLYGERVGALHCVCESPEVAARAAGQIKMVVRAMYSNPPIHGARVAALVLGVPELREQWQNELREVAGRIGAMRTQLKETLEKIGTPGDWSHVTRQIGMFSYTGLTEAQV